VALWYSLLKNLGLPSYLSASGEASSYAGSVSIGHSAGGYGTDRYIFSTNVVLYFKGLSLKNGGRWSNVVTKFGFSKVKSIKVTHLFDSEENDADRCNLLC